MRKINNILVPTDFSVTARYAYHYAKKLAITLSASVRIVHVTPHFVQMPEAVLMGFSEEEINRANQEAMDEFIADEDNAHEIMVKNKVKTHIIRGDIVNSLVELSRNDDTDLIVMGTTGLQDFLSKIIGSTSLEVANKAHCPVVLVPREAKWQPIKSIMYASNYYSTMPKMMHEVVNFARSTNAAIHFVHVEDFNFDSESNVTQMVREELFLLNDPSLVFEIHSIFEKDKIGALKRYAEEKNINIMAFVSKHRNYWQNLIHKSITENIAVSTDTPMMVMHLDD